MLKSVLRNKAIFMDKTINQKFWFVLIFVILREKFIRCVQYELSNWADASERRDWSSREIFAQIWWHQTLQSKEIENMLILHGGSTGEGAMLKAMQLAPS